MVKLVLVSVAISLIRLVATDPNVRNYTLGSYEQQDRFLIDSCPILSEYEIGTAPGKLLWVRSGGCEVTSFTHVTISFINNFNGLIIIRGNTPYDVLEGIPKFRGNELTASLEAGGRISVSVAYDDQLFKGELGQLVYDFVYSSAGNTHLVGNLMVIVQTADNSLCALNKVAFDAVQLSTVPSYETFNVRQAFVESPRAAPQFIQAADSPFPLIGVDWKTCVNFRQLWSLVLVRKTAAGYPVEPLHFPAYEYDNYRIVMLGSGNGNIQGETLFGKFNQVVNIGSTFRFDSQDKFWVLTQEQGIIGLDADFCVAPPQENYKYNFFDMKAKGPFLVYDISNSLANKQVQRVVTPDAKGLTRIC